ncbi:MAG: preprotein translocase subunit SecY [Candidatus Aenigmarchaeota archaeon]|nr:preprotein translocase subunit SecY [Candidatus Aenigmarchaeota archaeon]
MEEQQPEKEKKDFASRVVKLLPAISKPEYKQGLNQRLKWTGIALLLYLLLSWITIYGIAEDASFEQFKFFEIVLGSKFGSIMTLGIGPIVTGGIIMQLLVGSKILSWDTTKPEGRKKFQTWNKLLALALAFVEAAAFVLAGALPVTGSLPIILFAILQLAAGGIIVIMLDELVSKWGFGSGVSLFIAAGVATQVVIGLVSPLSVGGRIAGGIPGFIFSLLGGNSSLAIAYLLPIITTAIVFLIVVFAQHIKIQIPLSFATLRGFGRTWDLKLLYTSNIPVILTAALIANVQLLGRVGATVTPDGLTCSLMGCFDQIGNAVSGVVYYLSAPGGGGFQNSLLLQAVFGSLIPSEVIRALTYILFMAVGATIFSVFWVNTAGMGAATVAKQLDSSGMQIPGYRRDPKVMEAVLNRYIPPLSVMGGLAIGLLAAFADLVGAIGTGTGILLTVMIVYNYYEQLQREKLDDAHPLLRKIVGE